MEAVVANNRNSTRDIAQVVFGGRWGNSRGHAGMITSVLKAARELKRLGLVGIVPARHRFDYPTIYLTNEGITWGIENDSLPKSEEGLTGEVN